VTTGSPGAASYIAVRTLPDGRVRFGYLAQGIDDTWHESAPERLPPDRAGQVDIVADTRIGGVVVRLDRDVVLGLSTIVRPTDNATVGRNDVGGPVAATFAGEIVERAVEPTLCRDLLRS